MGTSVIDKNSPFSTPTKPLSSSVEAIENRLASPNLSNQMKFSTKKNFMSPTISAASKTVALRTKILAERNTGEAAEPTSGRSHRRRSSSFDLKAHGSVDLGSSIESLSSSVNEVYRAEDGVDDAKMRPYDPVLNYCSPRPKFLLYKPDRRSEILRRYEMIDVNSSESDIVNEYEEKIEVKQNVEIIEKTLEIGNRKEDVVVVDDEYIVEEITEKIEKGEDLVHKESDENHHEKSQVKTPQESNSTKPEHESIESKCEALETKEEDEINVEPEEIEDADGEEGEFEDESEVEKYWTFKRLLKFWFLIFVLGLSVLYLSPINSSLVGLNDDDWNVRNGLHGVIFVHKNVSGSVYQELAKIGFEEISQKIKDGIIIKEPDNDIIESVVVLNEVEKEGSRVEVLREVVYAKLIEMSTLEQVEATENEMDLVASKEIVSEECGAGKAGDITCEGLVHVEEATTPLVNMQLFEIDTENKDMVTEVVELHSEAIESAFAEMDGLADTNHHSEVTMDEITVFEGSLGEEMQVGEDWVAEPVIESGGDEMLNNLEKVEEVAEMVSTPVLVLDNGFWLRFTEETDNVVIVGVVSSVLLAFLGVLGFRKLKRANKILKENAADIPEQDTIRRHSQVNKFDQFTYSPYSKAVGNDYNSSAGAPRVELLGEYIVGEKEVSSYSLKTNSLENYNDSIFTYYMEVSTSHPAASGFSSTTETPTYGEQSSQRISLKKEAVPTSSIDSPSYGSFTTELMYRKEEARGVEKIVVTPVRRSSRIQSRKTPGVSQ